MNLKSVITPFVYYFSLSFGLIILTSYWLVTTPGSVQGTKASEGESLVANIVLSNPQLTYNYILKEKEKCIDSAAEKINKYLDNEGAPLAGYGCEIVKTARKYEIDPLLITAIAWCESNGGITTPQFGAQESYNAWGWGVFDNNDVTKAVASYGCDSWEHCIERVTSGIARKGSNGLEPEDIVQWYTPASVRTAGGDPELASWTKCVKGTIEKISQIKL